MRPIFALLSVLPFVLVLLDADLIRAALRHADISIAKAAIWMEMDRGLLDRQLDGEGHLSHRRLLMLPLGFHQWLSFLQCQRYGLPGEVRHAALIEVAVVSSREMVKVTEKEKASA